jgi:hypothetical protein
MDIYHQTLPVEALFPLQLCKIYKAKNIINNKIYIGFTTLKLNKRIYKHNNDSTKVYKDKRKKTYFNNAISKYGIESFDWEILYWSFYPFHCKNIMESYYIKLYNSCYRKENGHGYNGTLGGEGGMGNPAFFKNKKHSEETKEKMSLKRKGIKHSKSHVKNLTEATIKRYENRDDKKYYCLVTNVITGSEQTTNNLRRFCLDNNLSYDCMHKVLKGKNKSHKGFIVRYIYRETS